MFKNGDRIIVIGLNADCHDERFFFIGATGVVINDDEQRSLEVLFDEDADGNKESWWIDGSKVILAKSEENENA